MKKYVRWLDQITKHNFVSFRAWQLCDSSLYQFALSISFDVSDIPACFSHAYTNIFDFSVIERSDVWMLDQLLDRRGILIPHR